MAEQVNHIRTARDSIRKCTVLQQYSFLQVTSDALQETIQSCRMILESMKQELALYEESCLRIRKKDGAYYFGCLDIGSKKETSISKDPHRIHALARRSFLITSISAMEHRLKMLERIKGNSEEARHHLQMKKKLCQFANAGIDLSRIFFTKEQNEWMDEPFTPNPYNRGSLTTQTSSGIWMRSKSEAIIGSSLEAIGLPYRNDDLVRIIADYDGSMPFKDTYFADFKVPNLLGGITVHEHFGAFQINNYAENALQRLNDYHNHTVIEIDGRTVASNEFTWSFESDIRDTKKMKKLVRKMLLPL